VGSSNAPVRFTESGSQLTTHC